MADNLPLIPGKKAVCADVKPVLREVFREMDELPPILEKTSATDDEKQWLEKYNSECEKIWHQEGDLKDKFAKRISKKPALNLYRLHGPDGEPHRKQEDDLIDRDDLMPVIHQSAMGSKSLWVQNALNRSSCEFSYEEAPIAKLHQPLKTIGLDEHSRQTYSFGELPAWKSPRSPVEVTKPVPEYVYCVPEQINFVNFTLGLTYTQQLRLVNVSKFEIRLSVSLPKRSELKVELSGSRGLRVTAGSASELKIHFHPSDVRAFRDELRIRTSLGKGMVVPIVCLMEPPELHIFVQNMDKYLCTSTDIMAFKISENQGDVVDLGAKLLGDEHYASLVLQCKEAHASFFLLTEDSWIDYNIDDLSAEGTLKTGPFTIQPAWWAGGGVTRGTVRCLASTPGFHSADIRILSSTAVTRAFNIVADSVYYDSAHISILTFFSNPLQYLPSLSYLLPQAHEKDYDINSEDDPDCKYYVNLGTAFPNRYLSATIQIENHSPIQYSFYWKLRTWGVCSCWQEHLASSSYLDGEEMSDELCPGAQVSKEAGETLTNQYTDSISRVHLEPEGSVRERSSRAVRINVPHVGACGTHRVVLLFILKDIPIECFKPGDTPNVVCKRTVEEVGPKGNIWTRTVCDIVQSQVEVWWNVVDVRFVLDPPVLPLIHSRRVKKVPVSFCATQLYGVKDIPTCWQSSSPMLLPDNLQLSPFNSVGAKMVVPMPVLPNEYPEEDTITLKAVTNEWSAHCHVTRACATRHPALAPARHWLGVVVPGAKVSANLEVFNDTYQDICWWATPFRWMGENQPSKPCSQAGHKCVVCHERACTCNMIKPSRGSIADSKRSTIQYNVHAPMTDRIVATLVKVTRTGPDVATIPGAPACNARATLLAYRVLAPRLVLEVFPCGGNKKGDCEACDLDLGDGEKSQGCALLRPSKTLTPCCCSCYKLRITNTTPIATSVRWEPPIDGEEYLRVKFLPNDFEIGSYNDKTISVILEPRRVCGRRMFVFRAKVAHAYKPLYLLVDTAIEGVRIIFEVPLGGKERNDDVVALRGTQKETYRCGDTTKPSTPKEWFMAEDRKRAVVRENICDCKFELKYIPPTKPLRSPPSAPASTELVTTPPSWTRVCECFGKSKPVVPVHEEPCCLQFRDVPLKTVKSRRLRLRNDGKVTARWRMVIRRWPRQRNRAATIEALAVGGDRWAADVRSPGVAIKCVPAKGICTAGQSVDIMVQTYADCLGLYYDQIMLMVDHVDPIVVDLWIEAVGPVLHFATPSSAKQEFDSTMWLSTSDPEHSLRVKNTSRSQLNVRAYTLLEHGHSQDAWPFRLYWRFTDILKPICPCCNNVSRDSLDVGDDYSACSDEMDTGIEVFLAEDYGLQDDEYYKVEPRVCSVAPGSWIEFKVTLNPLVGYEIAPPGLVMLRTIPVDDKGDYWSRWEPAPSLVGIRQAARTPALRLSCQEVRAHLCALDLHYNEIARVRKRFLMRNIGTAPLLVHCKTDAPWEIVMQKPHNDCECGCVHEIGERCNEVKLTVEPWSSTAMCVEVLVNTAEMWPVVEDTYDVDKKCVLTNYPPKREIDGQIIFWSDQGLLETLPLVLEVSFPQLSFEPEMIDFGFVTHGDTRKTYFSVWHSDLSATITLGVSWQGTAKLRLYPRHLRLAPGKRERIYLQYTAVWTGAPVPVEGCVRISAAAGAGAWCRAAIYVRAEPARDAKFQQEVHDYTDQWNLWPPSLPRL